MAKKMFVVMEVRMLEGGWAIPIDTIPGRREGAIDESRVIYADEMKVENFEPVGEPIEPGLRRCKQITFYGVSPSPEEDEWEKWINSMPTDAWVNQLEFQGWLRRMPREKHGK